MLRIRTSTEFGTQFAADYHVHFRGVCRDERSLTKNAKPFISNAAYAAAVRASLDDKTAAHPGFAASAATPQSPANQTKGILLCLSAGRALHSIGVVVRQ